MKREIKRLSEENAFLKKAAYFAKEEKYALIRKYSRTFSIRLMCRVLSVSASGYYSWLARPASMRDEANLQLAPEIKAIYESHHQRVGSVRVTKHLKTKGYCVGRNRVANIMRLNGWRAKESKKLKATTNSKHTLPVAPNLLEQIFFAHQPNKKWVSDITYIWTQEGWIYLAVVMDFYSRIVVGWSISHRMTATLVIGALKMALWRRKMPQDVIVHSDRGSQYCSKEYQKLMTVHKLVCSMSKRGDCYDNAAMESWNGSFKVEAIPVMSLPKKAHSNQLHDHGNKQKANHIHD